MIRICRISASKGIAVPSVYNQERAVVVGSGVAFVFDGQDTSFALPLKAYEVLEQLWPTSDSVEPCPSMPPNYLEKFLSQAKSITVEMK